jgi:dihydrofolate reductase
MQKLIVFNNISLDGYFAAANGDFSWAKVDTGDAEFTAFVEGNVNAGGQLLFGRITYEMMSSFWPTENAIKTFPKTAEGMNRASKVVFSRTLSNASWNNTRLVKSDLASEVRKMKTESGKGIAILGSGSIVAQLAPARLIDEYQFMVNPVVLGKGRTMFEGVTEKINLKLTKTRTFNNGKVFLSYQPLP